jgi:repressor LexA
MRRKDDSKQITILNYINDYIGQYSASPSVREISGGTGIPRATVQRYLVSMDEAGEIEYDGRSIHTPAAQKMAPVNCVRVLGRVACGPGDEEQEEVLEYLRMPENLVGKGNFFALIAKGQSMIDAGIQEGDYVIVRQTQTAEIGEIVVALYDGLNNLKVLDYDKEREQYCLLSRNSDQKKYAPIYVTNLQVQGVAVGVYHKLK